MEAKRRRWGSLASEGAIALEALDCTVCYHPLSPPVFQGVQQSYLSLVKKCSPLFLVKFTPVLPFGNAASIVCVDPHAVAGERKFRCQVHFHCCTMGWRQELDFLIRSTTLSDGLPTEDGSYSFVVPTGGSSNPPTDSSIVISITKITRDDDAWDEW